MSIFPGILPQYLADKITKRPRATLPANAKANLRLDSELRALEIINN